MSANFIGGGKKRRDIFSYKLLPFFLKIPEKASSVYSKNFLVSLTNRPKED